MKIYTFSLLILLAFSAQAQNYICNDGTRIIHDSSTKVLQVVIDGSKLRCELTATSPEPGMCSSASISQCAKAQVSYGDCKTEFEYGKCVATSNLGPDGNPICGCGIGE